ncbi:hypothetical protein QUB47_15990 [Microcoleus sp. AT9_B5]
MNCSDISQNYDRHWDTLQRISGSATLIDGGNTCPSPDYNRLFALAINSGDRLRGLSFGSRKLTPTPVLHKKANSFYPCFQV